MKIIRLDRLSVNNKTILFLSVAFSYIIKFVLYRLKIGFDNGLNAWQTTGAYTMIVGASLLMACIGLRKSRIFLTLVIMIFTDLWLIANLLYHEANLVLINWNVILFAGNLRGFEESILVYIHWWLFIIPMLTVGLAVFLISYRKDWKAEKCTVKQYLVYGLVALFVYAAGFGIKQYGSHLYDRKHANSWKFNKEKRMFIRTHTPVAYFGYVLWDGLTESVFQIKSVMPLSEEEKQIIATIYTDSVSPIIPKHHLVYILVESFESWALPAKDQNGTEVCEHLNAYIRNHDLLLCTNLITQQKYGRSGDGQLITQTGMLPLSSGVTCMTHGTNVYPNLAHFYPKSVVLNPYPGVWNQHVTTYSYGYKRLREPSFIRKGTDSLIVDWARKELEEAEEPMCVLAITINTHAPFKLTPKLLEFDPEDDTYSLMEENYLQCVHYMDKHVGRFLEWADTASVMRDATIVITADHNHFPVKNGKGLCPLIIKSPAITQKTYIPQAFQMDIFPTVLHAIGQSDYKWKGFGIDLLNPEAKRSISPSQAYSLSDKMIRTNFFAE